MKFLIVIQTIFIIGITIQLTEACFTTSSRDLRCGKPEVEPINIARILNGFEAVPNSWPYIVSLGTTTERSICAGVLFNKETVITAAHCITVSPDAMRIYVGIHDYNRDVDSSTTHRVRSIKIHERYNSDLIRNDIAIIKLTNEVTESRNVKFICINRDPKLVTNEPLVVIGWGTTETGFPSSKLKQVTVNINDDICRNTFGSFFQSSTQICSGNVEERKGICFGDSGGPLMKRINGQWTLAGIISYTDTDCLGFNAYTRISSYYDWIMNNINF